MDVSSILDHLVCAFLILFGSISITYCMLKVRIIALPNHRSSHDEPTPSSGGVAIVLTTIGGFLYLGFFLDFEGALLIQIIGLIVGSLVVAIVGFVDDLGRLPNFKIKFLSQIFAALILFGGNLVFEKLELPFVGLIDLGLWGYVVTFVWVIGVTNAFNFMDGLNGMAGGTAVVAALFFALISLDQNAVTVFVLSYIVLAAALGFLPFNFPRPRIFMGDVGSQYLGFFFAGLGVLAAGDNSTQIPFWVMPLIFFHFIFDTSFTFLRRLCAGEVVTDAHRSHLYQLVNRMGWPHSKVSIFYASMAILQGFAAIWLMGSSASSKGAVFLSFFIVYTIFTLIVIRGARAKQII